MVQCFRLRLSVFLKIHSVIFPYDTFQKYANHYSVDFLGLDLNRAYLSVGCASFCLFFIAFSSSSMSIVQYTYDLLNSLLVVLFFIYIISHYLQRDYRSLNRRSRCGGCWSYFADSIAEHYAQYYNNYHHDATRDYTCEQ